MSDFELPVLQPQLLTMSDKDTPFREKEMRQVLEKYTTYDKTQINSTLREVKMIVNSNGNASNPSPLVSSDSFRDGVDWKQFFVDFINAMVGIKQFIQFTLLGRKMMFFKWEYGSHGNVYRLLCSTYVEDRERYYDWKLSKIAEDNSSVGSDTPDTPRGFMDNIEVNNDWDVNDEHEVAPDYAWAVDSDGWSDSDSESEERGHLSMQHALLTLESLHERLCRLGV